MYIKLGSCNTGSFKSPRLDNYGFYLVILPLGIKWAFILLGMTKTQGLPQDAYGYDCFYTRRDYVSTLVVSHRT